MVIIIIQTVIKGIKLCTFVCHMCKYVLQACILYTCEKMKLLLGGRNSVQTAMRTYTYKSKNHKLL